MPKSKLAIFDWKNPVDRKSLKDRLRLGKLDPVAWKRATILASCSAGYRKWAREQPDYRWLLGTAEAVKELGYDSVAAFEANLEERRVEILAKLARALGDEAFAGNAMAFRQIAECVEFIRTHGDSTWVDKLGQEIERYCRSKWLKTPKMEYDHFKENFTFNMEQFIEETKCSADHKTIAKRVRGLGFLINKGRPRGVKNKKR